MIELRTTHAEFEALHEAAAKRGKIARVDKETLEKVLADHSMMVAALRGQVKEPS
jgi:hypothetical protein